MSASANLGLPFLEAGQAQKHVTHNEALRLLDTLTQLAVLDRDLNAPPSSPADGQRWIVKASPSPTGTWAGHGNHVAAWQDGTWQFSAPKTGFLAYVVDEGALLYWDGDSWEAVQSALSGALQNVSLLGVGTTADATNPVSAKLNNALWFAKTVAEGGDGNLRYKLSKESAAKTLSFLFQDNFSGRAEIGLTGDDDFHFKVSPDGTSWLEGIKIDRNTGKVSFPASGGPREVLTANRTYYCDWTNGNDGNAGLAAGAGNAFKTIQKAWNTLVTIDLNGHTVTIQLADGTYTSGLNATVSPVGGSVVINGNSATPANIVVSTTAVDAIRVACLTQVTVQNFEVRTTTSGEGLYAIGAGAEIVTGTGFRFGACATRHMLVTGGGAIILGTNYTMAGAATFHAYAQKGTITLSNGITVTNSGTNAFSVFAYADAQGLIASYGATFTGGTVTGQRYNAVLNGVIQTYGGGANYFPGNSAGSTATGGQYV
jgi:hypothetical protein